MARVARLWPLHGWGPILTEYDLILATDNHINDILTYMEVLGAETPEYKFWGGHNLFHDSYLHHHTKVKKRKQHEAESGRGGLVL